MNFLEVSKRLINENDLYSNNKGQLLTSIDQLNGNLENVRLSLRGNRLTDEIRRLVADLLNFIRCNRFLSPPTSHPGTIDL